MSNLTTFLSVSAGPLDFDFGTGSGLVAGEYDAEPFVQGSSC